MRATSQCTDMILQESRSFLIKAYSYNDDDRIWIGLLVSIMQYAWKSFIWEWKSEFYLFFHFVAEKKPPV